MNKPLLGTRPEPTKDVGERLRSLRVAAGLTQSDLAEGRFSKEYVSQIERGKTRPTAETLEWLAERLGVDPAYLGSGVSAEERSRVEAALARAEALLEQPDYGAAAREFEVGRAAVAATGAPDLELRSLLGETWALIQEGQMETAMPLLERARDLAERPTSTDVDRAAVLLRHGVMRYHRSSISTAIALLTEALELATGSEDNAASGLPCDSLRGDILDWRSRCYRRQRDWLAAREDVERALELADSGNDKRSAAQAYFQASLVAEREGSWLLARTYAERARGYYEELEDRATVGRLLNNLGLLNHSLGNPEKAVEFLSNAVQVALEVGDEPEAGTALTSLAQVHLDISEAALAEDEATRALALLGDRPDYLQGIGVAQLVLGRALLEQNRLIEAEESLRAADSSFEQSSSVSHRAAAWVAQGDLAQKTGADREAARLYRRAAEALQDFRF